MKLYDLKAQGLDLQENIPLSRYTFTQTGGPAEYLAFPKTLAELKELLAAAREDQLPITVIGNASNLIIRDKGIKGLVVILTEMNEITVEGDKVVAQAGAKIIDTSFAAGNSGLSGLEFAAGIPGSVGGAVFMNAGAYDGEMSHVVSRVRVVDRKGSVRTYEAPDFGFSYRQSRFQKSQEFVVEVEMTLRSGKSDEIQAKMDDLMNRRRSKQPLEMHSAGSTFKRPPGYFAGTLIDQTGLKGLSCGDAQVSVKHAGFVVNTGHASARDVLNVIHEVQARVEQAHGVHLEPEVRIIGED